MSDVTAQQSAMVQAGVASALADAQVRRAWARLIARSVAKGVFFGGILLMLLGIAAWFVIAAVIQAR